MVSGLKRFQYTGRSHFVTFSCYQRLPLLSSDAVRVHFLTTLERLRVSHQFDVFGYVLMPEHVHLFLSEPKYQPLSMALQVLKQNVSRKCAPLAGIIPGHFWLTRYYDFNIRSIEKRIEKLRYIHRNPVKRGLVRSPEEWKWSSYRNYFTGESGIVKVSSEWVMWWTHKTPTS